MLGESGYVRQTADAYWTPEWCVDVLLRHIRLPRGCVWEPACGIGNISKVILPHRPVFSSDLHTYGAHSDYNNGVDFLTCDLPHSGVYSIITNPPYNLSDEFVRRAIWHMKPRDGLIAMLLRNEWDSAASRTPLFERLYAKLVLTKRPRWSDDNTASPRHNFAWFIWDFSQNTYPRIMWDKP